MPPIRTGGINTRAAARRHPDRRPVALRGAPIGQAVFLLCEFTTMKGYRSAHLDAGTKHGGARGAALARATGMKDADFEEAGSSPSPTASPSSSPGTSTCTTSGQRVKKVVDAAGGWGVEFNATIAVDDGIAMGHGGMLYSLPSRDLIADSVEQVHGERALRRRALVCISNWRQDHPRHVDGSHAPQRPDGIFVSGGPMEAGKMVGTHGRDGKALVRKLEPHRLDDRVVGRQSQLDQELGEMERSACPTCGSCSGMFTANSMNCLNEALGLALPGNGTLLATHARRWELFESAGRRRIVEMANRCYVDGDTSVLPRSIAPKAAFENAMTLDIAMGGSTNTVLHILAIAHASRSVDFTMKDIDRLSRKVPNICKVAPIVALPRRGRAPREQCLHHPGRARSCGPHRARRRHGPPVVDGRRDRRERSAPRDGDGGRPAARARRAGRRPRAVRPSRRTNTSRTPISMPPRAASAISSMPTARTAAWPCSMATSRSRAAS